MNHCGWIICPYNSEHDKDFDLTDGYCKQDKEHCELRDNPEKVLKEVVDCFDIVLSSTCMSDIAQDLLDTIEALQFEKISLFTTNNKSKGS